MEEAKKKMEEEKKSKNIQIFNFLRLLSMDTSVLQIFKIAWRTCIHWRRFSAKIHIENFNLQSQLKEFNLCIKYNKTFNKGKKSHAILFGFDGSEIGSIWDIGKNDSTVVNAKVPQRLVGI